MKIEHNKALFATYAALTVTGYHLADTNSVALQTLISHIRNSLHLTEEAYSYFCKARTDEFPVNPYFPVASELASACFFLAEDGSVYKDADAYLDFLRDCNNGIMTPDAHSRYLLCLPEMLACIMQNREFPALLQEHYALVRSIPLDPTTDAIIDHAISRFPTSTPPVFAPCLLQSPMIADFARYGQSLYVISASPKPQTMLHEWLHIVIAQKRDLLTKLLCKQDTNKLYDPQKLHALGYLRGNTPQHHLHALEECIVQGLTAHFALSVKDAESQVTQACEQGFYTTRTAWLMAQSISPNQENLGNYLSSLFIF